MSLRLCRFSLPLFLSLAWCISPLSAQSWDNSGDSQLHGTYYFRQVLWVVGDNSGDLGDAVTLFGNITFDGNGNYTVSASGLEYQSGSLSPQSFTSTGTYSIAASGLGFINSLVSNDAVYGMVSHGTFIGTTSENGQYNDIFIATPVGSPLATNSTFQGTYTIAGIDFPFATNGSGASPLSARDYMFQVTPDGQGNLGSISATGYIGQNGTTSASQTISGGRYAFSNGGAQLTFGGTLTNLNLLAGGKIMYISPDGNFVFGGSANGWDLFVGVRTSGSSTANNLSGLYYQAGVDEDLSTASQGYASIDSYWGSFSANAGTIVAHQRYFPSLVSTTATDYTYSDSYAVGSSGSYTSADGSAQYVVGAGGLVRVGLGKGPTLGINVALQAPTFTGTGVFLNPTGISNAASSAPFTAGLSRGELITLYGSNLANDTVVAQAPFPTTLDNVQVMINGVAAPIYYVSATQVSAVVPYATAINFAQIQVVNNNQASNIASTFMAYTSPGVFTNPVGGLGYAAALHPDYSLVLPSSPAQAGETVAVYVTGLGDVDPAVPDGSVGPATTLSNTTNTFTASIGGLNATVTYAGLAPNLAGLYQINVTIPSGVASGAQPLVISGPDSFTAEATLPVGAPFGASSVTAHARTRVQASGRPRTPFVPHAKPWKLF